LRSGASKQRSCLGRGGRGPGWLRHRLRRPARKVLDPLVEPPEVIGADLTEVADAILAVDAEPGDRP
jgi:hypothetical protein